MRVLLTGMTAQQVNSVNHDRSPNFPGLLRDALAYAKHEVVWSEPSVAWDAAGLSEFDLVIVGVAPLTALGANRAYGALSIIEHMWDDPRLRLLVDAPDPLKMESASQSLCDHPENLTKDFFKLRKQFDYVKAHPQLQERLTQAVRYLNYCAWPRTIVPQLPWQSTNQLDVQLPRARGQVVPVNLDWMLFERFERVPHERERQWAYEPGSHPTWGRHTHATWPMMNLPKSHRKDVISTTINLLSRSVGCIICPSKTGTWWSPRFAMSLSQMTPVFTDWHETQFLSNSWTHLPGSFELMVRHERDDVAKQQHDAYVATIPHYLPEI